MEGNMSTSRRSRRSSLLGIGLSALVVAMLALPATLAAQTRQTVTGTVTTPQGQPASGVRVGIVGGGGATVTDASGRYSLSVPANAALSFTHIAYQPLEVNVAGRTTVNVQLSAAVTRLEELVVTGYQTQRRADVTAAVSSVNLEAVETQTSSSVIQRLSGRVPGVTVETSGSPGARSTVRVRGVSSFQNNNPLYIIDGVPVEESFANFLNPNDVESIQVLKDASAASIYGSRASNGVVIITTKKGQRAGAPQFTLDVNYGIANAYRGYDDFLIQDPLDYFEFERRRYVNAGLPIPTSLTSLYGDPANPSIPAYIYVHPSAVTSRDQWGRPVVDESKYSFPNALIMPGSAGTNWWDEVFGTGETRDANLAVRGGGQDVRYSVGFNYFDQSGTARGNRFQRGTVRVNTDFNVGRFTVGENFTVAGEESYGGLGGDNFGEGSLIGKNILSQPVIPVYDIQGNFASGKATGLGNNTNPVKEALRGPDNRNRNFRIFGNAFARMTITEALSANTSLGINAGEASFRGFNPIYPENSEPTLVNSISENFSYFTNYTLTNTLNFQQAFRENHNVTLLAGQEAIRSRDRGINASMAGLVSTDVNARYIQAALGDPATRNVTSNGGISALLSFFGKADYNYADRYYLSGTLRRDGSSRLGEEYRWGTFPAFSAGWRVSEEPFMADNAFLTNLMLRFGWGVVGNQNIPTGRTVSGFGGSIGTSFYDINGADTRVVTGYRQTSIGNPLLKWEENQSTNFGIDAEFLGMATLELDFYERNSNNLLFNPPLPATAGQAAQPIVNIGKMQNRGIEGSFGLRGTVAGEVDWNLNLNGSTYRNRIKEIDGQQTQFPGPIGTRTTPSVTMNKLGEAIGSFWGYQNVGFFESQQEIDQLNAQAKQMTGRADAVYWGGAKAGRLKFADINGRDPATGLLTGRPDGVVNADDQTIIGSPHPDFTGGLNFGINWRDWDLSADVFGTFGNDIFDVQKEFYVFRYFPTNVREDLLTDSWTPGADNSGAKYPILDATDQASYVPSSFYVEDGSYVRMRSLQLGYNVPSGGIRGFETVRIFVRGENLFTITGYDGLDPALPALATTGSGGDIRDQARGIDRGVYPTSRIFTIGFGVGF